MAVELVKATAITNADATPPVLTSTKIGGGRSYSALGTAELTATASIASIVRFCRVPSNAVMTDVVLKCDAITSGAGDIGLYDTLANGSAVVDADFFASAQSIATALPGTSVIHESGVLGVEDVELELWQVLGLSADPQKQYDVALTLTAAATAAGTVSLVCRYCSGN